jgi:murein DD-endopeptidase MepM/ murein hydrolase activator NlpD
VTRRRLGRPAVRHAAAIVACAAVLAGCASAAGSPTTTLPALAPVGSLPRPVATSPVPDVAVSAPSTTAVATTVIPTTTTRPNTTPYVVPVAAGVHISYGRTHHDYPASDIFATTGCGTPLVSPVNGRILEVRRADGWTRKENNPATRGGLTVAVLGDDGVRYYLAHLQLIDDGIEPGTEVTAGQRLGEMGRSGDASACHLHFGISPPCADLEWSVRRGVIWPWSYLDAWRQGDQRSPALEIYAWSLDHPDACAQAAADPDAAASG